MKEIRKALHSAYYLLFTIYCSLFAGWGERIRTPVSRSRVCRPATGRLPNCDVKKKSKNIIPYSCDDLCHFDINPGHPSNPLHPAFLKRHDTFLHMFFSAIWDDFWAVRTFPVSLFFWAFFWLISAPSYPSLLPHILSWFYAIEEADNRIIRWFVELTFRGKRSIIK